MSARVQAFIGMLQELTVSALCVVAVLRHDSRIRSTASKSEHNSGALQPCVKSDCHSAQLSDRSLLNDRIYPSVSVRKAGFARVVHSHQVIRRTLHPGDKR